MNQKCNPIGVFDSGIGGISTLKEMIRELPREHFIYYGDTANAPYGTKSTEEVIGCVRKVVEHLQGTSICTADCVSATSVNWVMDRILGKI